MHGMKRLCKSYSRLGRLATMLRVLEWMSRRLDHRPRLLCNSRIISRLSRVLQPCRSSNNSSRRCSRYNRRSSRGAP